jgi:hypothetical protein
VPHWPFKKALYQKKKVIEQVQPPSETKMLADREALPVLQNTLSSERLLVRDLIVEENGLLMSTTRTNRKTSTCFMGYGWHFQNHLHWFFCF